MELVFIWKFDMDLLSRRRIMMGQSKYEIPTGYTVFGNPTITNGLMTIPGGMNGIITPLVFNPGNQVWEIQTRILYKFTRYSYVFRSCTSEGVGTFSVGMQMDNGNTFRFIYSTNGTSWVNSRGVTNAYTLDSWIWIKVGWNGSRYYHKFSLDGVNWTENSSAGATAINQGSYILFGEPESNRYSQSTWDLNNTQFLIGGKVRWKAIGT